MITKCILMFLTENTDVIKLEVSEISFSQDFGFTKENQQRPLLCRRQCSHMMSVYFRYIP